MDALAAAQKYHAAGFSPIPCEPGEKRPSGRNWTEGLAPTTFAAEFRPRCNVGVLLGPLSGDLVDVDLDCEEAVRLADRYLPETSAITGRGKRPRSHRWYRCKGLQTRNFKDEGAIILEARGGGRQTIVGPSVHPDGDTYDLLDFEVTDVPEVTACDLLLACENLARAVADARRRHDQPTLKLGPGCEPIDTLENARRYLAKIPGAVSGRGGHNPTYWAARVLVHGFALDAATALQLLEEYNARCEPPWTAKELKHKIDDAANKPFAKPYGWLVDEANVDFARAVQDWVEPPRLRTARTLIEEYPALRSPVIDGLLRKGETANIIAAPKVGKSWLVLDLALAVATGRPWLGVFPTTPGDVLILDNELHPESSAHRVPRVADARGIGREDWVDSVVIENLRGRLQSIDQMHAFFDAIEPGRFKIIILDAFYRFMPSGDENDNALMASVYNLLDRYAAQLESCFVLIHHSSKGNQSQKGVTDVGAGAGSQSRAADCHLILRPHEQDGVIVLDAAVRSFPPVAPMCLRWEFPLFDEAEEVDPTKLQGAKGATRVRMSPEEFARAFGSIQPRAKRAILGAAEDAGMAQRAARNVFEQAIEGGLLRFDHRERVTDFFTLSGVSGGVT